MARRRAPRPTWADEFEVVGEQIDPDGTVLVYHATTRGRAEEILLEGILRRPPRARAGRT